MSEIQIPDEVVEAAAMKWCAADNIDWDGTPGLQATYRCMARAAISAALAAWPGMVHMPLAKANGLPREMWRPEHIILPLEPRHE